MTAPARTLPPVVDRDAYRRTLDALRAARHEARLVEDHEARVVELVGYAAVQAAKALGDSPAARALVVDVIRDAVEVEPLEPLYSTPGATKRADTTPAPTSNEATV